MHNVSTNCQVGMSQPGHIRVNHWVMMAWASTKPHFKYYIEKHVDPEKPFMMAKPEHANNWLAFPFMSHVEDACNGIARVLQHVGVWRGSTLELPRFALPTRTAEDINREVLQKAFGQGWDVQNVTSGHSILQHPPPKGCSFRLLSPDVLQSSQHYEQLQGPPPNGFQSFLFPGETHSWHHAFQ